MYYYYVPKSLASGPPKHAWEMIREGEILPPLPSPEGGAVEAPWLGASPFHLPFQLDLGKTVQLNQFQGDIVE